MSLLVPLAIAAFALYTSSPGAGRRSRKKRRERMPELEGFLDPVDGLRLERVEEPGVVQASFHPLTHASLAEWSASAAEWIFDNLDQDELEILVDPEADDLKSALKGAIIDRAAALNQDPPSRIVFYVEGVPPPPPLAGRRVFIHRVHYAPS